MAPLGPGGDWPRRGPASLDDPPVVVEDRDLRSDAAALLVERAQRDAVEGVARGSAERLARARTLARGEDDVADEWAASLRWALGAAVVGVVGGVLAAALGTQR